MEIYKISKLLRKKKRFSFVKRERGQREIERAKRKEGVILVS